jgi:O-antigen/teichoic acid export membrane protein
MGVIKRQGFKQSIVNYAGTAVGAISTLFIYPNEPELYGLWLAMYAMASLFLHFASFGINSLTIRYFPRFRDDESDHHGFLPFLLIASLIFFSVFTGVFALFHEPLMNGLTALQFDISIIDTHVIPIFALTLIILLQRILTSYISNFQRIVVPAMITSLWPKIAIAGLILIAWLGYLGSTEFVWGILFIQFVQVIFLFVYLGSMGELRLRPSFEVLRSGMLREMGSYSMYGILGGLGSILAFRIDHIMISMLIGLANTGVYGIAQFIGNSITVPARAVMALTGPMISEALEKNNLEKVRMLYRKTSLNLLIIVLPMYAIVVLSVDDIFKLTSHYETLRPAVAVVLLIGLGKIVSVSFSVNGQILVYSKFYRFNLIAILLLAVTNITLNYWLIPEHGIVGAAMASFVALIAYNLFIGLFLWIKLRLHPFSWRTGVVFIIAFISGVLSWTIPNANMPLLNIAQYSVLVIIFYFPTILALNISSDINEILAPQIKKLRNFISPKH